MVIRLLPSQIVNVWDYIKYGLQSTRPATITFTQENMNKILENLLMGILQCWAVIDDRDDIYGFCLTCIDTDNISGNRFLVIYEYFTLRQVPDSMAMVGLDVLLDYARVNNCSRIVAYSDVPQIIDMAEKSGFSSNCRYLIKEV